MRILVVDDSKAVQSFVRTALAETNWELISAGNGAEALEIFKSSGVFDLILMDWEMPVADGPHAVAAIRASGSNVPIVMMTTRNAPQDILAMLDAGVNDYIMKPYTKDILILKIDALTEEVGGRRAG